MAGAIRLGELCHIMRPRSRRRSKRTLPEGALDELRKRWTALSLDVERMETALPKEEEAAPAVAAPAAAAPPCSPSWRSRSSAGRAAHRAAAVAARCRAPPATLRRQRETLDHLINESGEVAIARSRVEASSAPSSRRQRSQRQHHPHPRQLREAEVQADSQMHRGCRWPEKAASSIRWSSTLYAPAGADADDAGRPNDITSIQAGAVKNVGDTDAALLHQARISAKCSRT